jgi:hypothetical protein
VPIVLENLARKVLGGRGSDWVWIESTQLACTRKATCDMKGHIVGFHRYKGVGYGVGDGKVPRGWRRLAKGI